MCRQLAPRSTREKVLRLIEELKHDLISIEKQERLQIVGHDEGASIRKSILQSIEDLRRIPCG